MELKLIEKHLLYFEGVTILEASEKEVKFTEKRYGYEWSLTIADNKYQLKSETNDTHLEFISICDVTDFLFC